jgi:hypothetical protein
MALCRPHLLQILEERAILTGGRSGAAATPAARLVPGRIRRARARAGETTQVRL